LPGRLDPSRGHLPAAAHEPLSAKATWFDLRVFAGLSMATALPYNRVFRPTERAMTVAIEIYTRPGCGYCSAAKSLLTRKKAAFTEYSVATDAAYRDEMYDRAGAGSTFPQIFIGEAHVGGCDELYALDREGKLDGMLGSEGVS